jgi:hypothetical protein
MKDNGMPANDMPKLLTATISPARKVIHNGKVYYGVGAAARMLSTSATKIKEMMDRGDLEWTQLRVNGRILISAESIVACKYPGGGSGSNSSKGSA